MNYRTCCSALTLLVFLSWLAGTASAAEYDWMKQKADPAATETTYNNQYILFRAGLFFPDITLNGEKLDMNVSSGAEAGYGIQPFPWLAAEASFGYIETDDYDDDLTNQHVTVQMVPVTGTIRAILPIAPLDLYALVGGGMYYTMLKSDNLNQYDGSSEDDDKVLFGYHYGGGISLQLGRYSTMGLEARRIETRWDDLDIAGTFVTAFFRMGL